MPLHLTFGSINPVSPNPWSLTIIQHSHTRGCKFESVATPSLSNMNEYIPCTTRKMCSSIGDGPHVWQGYPIIFMKLRICLLTQHLTLRKLWLIISAVNSYKDQRDIIMCPMYSVFQTALPLTLASMKKENIGFPYPIPINCGSYCGNWGDSSLWLISLRYSEHSIYYHKPHWAWGQISLLAVSPWIHFNSSYMSGQTSE